MVFVPAECLQRIKTSPGKYAMEDNSWISAKLQVWWNFVASLMPICLSANTITVAAVGPTVSCMLLALVIGYPVPTWFQILCGLSVFIFQTFDAVDGKQARRLGTSSPLGDFLDHVVDSVSIMAIVTTLMVVINARPFVALICCFMAYLDFVIVHWEAAKTSVMVMDNGTSITEAQLVMMSVFFVCVFFGTTLWTIPIFFLTLGEIFALVVIAILPGKQILICMKRVFQKCGGAVFAEILPAVGYTILFSFAWCVRYGADRLAYAMLLVFLHAILLSTCVTLNRLSGYPLNWKRTLFESLLAVFTPVLSGPSSILPSLCLLATTAAVLYFLYDVATSIAKTLGVPVFANPPHVYAQQHPPATSSQH